MVARNTNGGIGCADHTGYGPEDHYNAFRGRIICQVEGRAADRDTYVQGNC